MTNTAGASTAGGSAASPAVRSTLPPRSAEAVALVLGGVLLGILLAVALGQSRSPTLVAPNATGDRIPTAQAPHAFVPATTAGHLVPLAQHVPPVEIAAPVIGLRSVLAGLRLDADGSLQVPTDYAQAGWYSQGPAPGDVGEPAVIVGHVDSTTGPAVFFKLRELRAGDPVLVRRADGSSVRFVVYRTAQYPKEGFPARKVYAPGTDAELRLITCTGDFDRATGHYLGNYVVYARAKAAK